MTTFLVIKRMKEDRTYMPGEVLVDPERSGILVERGYLTIVPDDYGKKLEALEEMGARRPSVQEALDAGYSEEAAKSLAAGRDTKKVREETEKINERLSRRDARPDLAKIAELLGSTEAEVLELSDEEYDEVVKENLVNSATGDQPVVPPVGDEPSKGTDAGPDKPIKDPNSAEAVVDRDTLGTAEEVMGNGGDGNPGADGSNLNEDEK